MPRLVQVWRPWRPGEAAAVLGDAELHRPGLRPSDPRCRALISCGWPWLAIDWGRAAAYPDRKHADDTLLTFTSGPLLSEVHVLGFPVVTMRLATSGTDGAVYVYLEDVDPDGDVAYLTEGCLRFLHRGTTGLAEPMRLGVPRTFARTDALRVVPGRPMGLAVQLLPVSAVVPAGHRIRVAIAGHDASCFTSYGPAGETFTLELGNDSHLDLPVRYG